MTKSTMSLSSVPSAKREGSLVTEQSVPRVSPIKAEVPLADDDAPHVASFTVLAKTASVAR